MSVEHATAAERKTHARAAVLHRYRAPGDAELLAARAAHTEAALAAHITRVVNASPPLTAEQRERIAALLRAPMGSASGGDPAA